MYMYVFGVYYYVLYNTCIKFLYLCVYEVIDLFCNHVIFRATTHEITARNHTDSKNHPHDDENHMKYWHRIFIFFYIVACFYIS